MAIIDGYSRRVLSWRISNSREAEFCVDCLEQALRTHGKPEIFNRDQGSQFTSEAFTGVLTREGIILSMDGRGRAFDNTFVERLWRTVKYEDVYLKGYATMGERMALGQPPDRAGGVFRLLQRWTPAPSAEPQDAGPRVSNGCRRRRADGG